MENDRRPASRAERFWAGANARGIPLQAIVATVAIVAATYLAGKLLYRLRDVVLLLLLAAFIAVLLNPIVAALQHRGIRRRGLAVFVVTVLAVLVFAGLAAAFGIPLSRGITHLAHAMPGYVAQADHGRGWAGHLLRQYHVAAWVRSNESKLVKFGQDLAGPALTVGKGAVSLLAALATVFVLVVLLLLEGPALMQGALNAMSPAHAQRFSRIIGEASRSATGYMAGNCLTSLIAGIVVFVTLVVLRVPFPFVWGLWVALVDLLPIVGGALAGIPTVLFAAAHSLTAGIVTAVVFRGLHPDREPCAQSGRHEQDGARQPAVCPRLGTGRGVHWRLAGRDPGRLRGRTARRADRRCPSDRPTGTMAGNRARWLLAIRHG